MADITLRDGSTTSDPRLDRLVQFDERSRGYPIRSLLTEQLPLRSVAWRCDTWLDQDREGACVGFSWAHELAALPVAVPADMILAQKIYRDAQKIDEFPGEAYEGTSVLAGAKIVQSLGYMDEYRWAFGVDDALRAVSYSGPVVIGVPWLASMMTPRPSGLLEIDRRGQVAGGHAILVRGLALRSRLPGEERGIPVIRLRNSWGREWGHDGDCFIKVDDFDWLLQQDGDCCVPMQRSGGPSPVTDAEAMAEMSEA